MTRPCSNRRCGTSQQLTLCVAIRRVKKVTAPTVPRPAPDSSTAPASRPTADVPHEATILLGDCPLTLLSARAAVLRPSHTLVLSDLHWGRDHTLRATGSAVPAGPLTAQLERLARLIALIRPNRVVVVGDLIHTAVGLTSDLHEQVRQFRAASPVPMTLVRGNHDRVLRKSPVGWDLDVRSEALTIDGVMLVHEPPDATDTPFICGHLHPTVAIGRGSERMRLPCFHLRQTALTLPAFCLHTGGPAIHSLAGDRIWAIADGLVEVPAGPMPRSTRASRRRQTR